MKGGPFVLARAATSEQPAGCVQTGEDVVSAVSVEIQKAQTASLALGLQLACRVEMDLHAETKGVWVWLRCAGGMQANVLACDGQMPASHFAARL